MIGVMGSERFTLRAHRAFQWGNWIGLYGFVVQHDNRDTPTAEVKNVVIEKIEDRDRYEPKDPVMQLDRDAAQQLMEDLWQCGVRPRQAAGSVGQLDAVNKHLEDMRKIAFHYIEAEQP